MPARLKRTAATVLLVVFAVGGLAASTKYIEKYRYRPYLHDSLYLPSGAFIEIASLGYRQIVADLVWFSAIQYYGDYRLDNHGLAYFRGLIDIVTKLDPHFIFAYKFAAIVVTQDLQEFDVGIDILKHGMGDNPLSWELPFEIGFLHYVNARDFNVGARYFNLAAKLPEAPERAHRFAAFSYSKAGAEDASVRLWEEYAETTDNAFLKELAEHYIQRLRAQGDAYLTPTVNPDEDKTPELEGPTLDDAH